MLLAATDRNGTNAWPPQAPTMASIAFLDICIGDETLYENHTLEYKNTYELLNANYRIYGLPAVPEELSEEQREILVDLNPNVSSWK